MSFRRHYGTGSYSSSLLSSPLISSYGSSRGLGGYSSGGYSTPHHGYTATHNNYSSYTPSYSSGKGLVRSRSASLPREVRERSTPRSSYSSSYSRNTSPTRASNAASVAAAAAVATAAVAATAAASVARKDLMDIYNDYSGKVSRHHSFTNGRSTSSSPRNGSHYTATKALLRAGRSKSVGSNGSLSSGYGSTVSILGYGHL
ncbi:hypothetical protein Pmani_024541 [Petrolisthes manimaculis]|uniref:Uncharacterized protein n=1 Tax=Petrolisthes manimaculis TaxID=1843537 RepID=A0AAE1P7Z6_9EUCA|nr:hypothetical protein Pmani_024541 [Petrolisthes manimaculis]